MYIHQNNQIWVDIYIVMIINRFWRPLAAILDAMLDLCVLLLT